VFLFADSFSDLVKGGCVFLSGVFFGCFFFFFADSFSSDWISFFSGVALVLGEAFFLGLVWVKVLATVRAVLISALDEK